MADDQTRESIANFRELARKWIAECNPETDPIYALGKAIVILCDDNDRLVAERDAAIRKSATALTPARISEIAGQAYRLLGYRSVRFRDGSFGILKCPAKTISLMNTFQELLMNEVDPPETSATEEA